MTINPEIIITEDGSQTMRHPVLGDSYHSLRGAVGEALHVYIHNGLHWSADQSEMSNTIRILEVGFGSGLNAWLTLQQATKMERSVEYTAIELYPIDMQTVAKLSYTTDHLFEELHACPWGEFYNITPTFSLKKIEGDLVDTIFGTTFDLIYFDAFAPDCQNELWSVTIFDKLYTHLTKGGALVTYSAKGSVKQALREAGFTVHRLQGAMGKRHMIRATKD